MTDISSMWAMCTIRAVSLVLLCQAVLLSVSGEPAGAIILTATAPSSVREEALAFETNGDPQ